MNINDITYAINGAIFEVNRVLGPGFLEKVYENALLIELKKQGLRAESQVPIKVIYKENAVGEYLADILVEGRVIVELKTVQKLDKTHEAQLLNYLKATGIKVGLLVNFKDPKVEIKRMVLNLDELVKSRHSSEACAGLDPVTGVQTTCNHLKRLDSGFRRNDKKWCFSTFYEVVNIRGKEKPGPD